MLLAIACFKNFVLYQLDIKSAFLIGFINEDVFVAQHQDFIYHVYPNYVFKLKKAHFGFCQAPRAGYDRLKDYFLANGFKFGAIICKIS